MRYFDAKNSRLVFIEHSADQHYWDTLWEKNKETVVYWKKLPYKHTIADLTKRFLPAGSTILEGGAGLAQNSWALRLCGYRTIALDYAEKTVSYLEEKVPEVNPVLGNVTCLPLSDASVDGYWSLGVIEHFFEGYDAILSEMARVVKKNGFLFITFPAMNPLRSIKARFDMYRRWDSTACGRSDFYQYALDVNTVIRDIQTSGFSVVAARRTDGIKGLKDEIPVLKPILQKIYESRNPVGGILKRVINLLSNPFCGHTCILVCQRTE